MKHVLFVWACLVVLCTACSNGGDGDCTIRIAQDQKNQSVYADDTERTIEFTAAEAWSTRVNYPETKAAEGEDHWITLDPASGDAGEVTIHVTLATNFTGKNRKAEITITCGGTQITVIIEQKGETEAGNVPDEGDRPVLPDPDMRRIARIIEYDEEYKTRLEFTYDEAGRVLTYKYFDWDGSAFSVKGIDASWNYADDRVVCKSLHPDGTWSYTSVTTSVLRNGRIVESEEKGEETNGETGEKDSSTERRTYEYDEAGQLKLSKYYSNSTGGTYESVHSLVWKDGVIVSETFQDGNEQPMQYTYEYYDFETVAPKPLAFDFISAMLMDVGEYNDMLTGHVNIFGNRYLKKIVSTGDKWNKENGTETFRYETDAAGYVTKIFRTWTREGEPAGEECLAWEIEYE